MKKLWKWLFGAQKKKLDIPVVNSITCGEQDENGFCDTYVNGEKSNVRLLIFNKEQVEKIREAQKQLRNNDNK